MSRKKHIPEPIDYRIHPGETPWDYITTGPAARSTHHVRDATGYCIAAMARKTDADRIVACVNACADLPDPGKLSALIAKCRDERNPGLIGLAGYILTALEVAP